MAYNANNPPVRINYGGLTSYGATEAGGGAGADSPAYGGNSIWMYKSQDPIATVQGANYITDGIQRGMEVNDLVYVIDLNLNHSYLVAVLSKTLTTPGPPGVGSVSLSTAAATVIY